MLVTRISSFTGKMHTSDVAISIEQLSELSNPSRKRRIQEICSDLNADDREYLLTGVTPEEWTAVFGFETN